MQDSSGYGQYILPLGDQNNDGYNDWAVVACRHTENVATDTGYVEFFHGGNPPSTQPYATLHVPIAPWGAAGGLGDLNGDGYADWYLKVWTPQHNGYRIQIYLGSPTAPQTPVWSFVLGGADDFGPVGDFNGDGFGDFFWYYYNQIYGDIFFGGDPLDTIPDWTLYMHPGTADWAYPQAFGDLNGDNYSDWIGRNFGFNITYIFQGSAHPDTLPLYTWPGPLFGPIGIVRDLNWDGHDELVCRSSWSVRIVLGADSLDPANGVTVNFPCTTPEFASSAGDINRDGFQDFLLWTDNCYGGSDYGLVALYLGHAVPDTAPVAVIPGSGAPYDLLGLSAAVGLGDVNGDGAGDVAMGSFTDHVDIGWRGRAIILGGDTTLPAKQPRPQIAEQLSISVYPNPFNSVATIQLEVPAGVAQVALTTFNLLGQAVKQERLAAKPGINRFRYQDNTLASGLYFLSVEAGAFQATSKLLVLK